MTSWALLSTAPSSVTLWPSGSNNTFVGDCLPNTQQQTAAQDTRTHFSMYYTHMK